MEVAPRCSPRTKRPILTRSLLHERESRPTRFHGFQFCRRWSATFFPQPFFNPSLSRFLPYPRFFNSHAWARNGPPVPVLLRPVPFPLSDRARAATPKARAFKRRIIAWPFGSLMHSIVDLCTIHVQYIGTRSVYEINFVHAPLASRPCNYQ